MSGDSKQYGLKIFADLKARPEKVCFIVSLTSVTKVKCISLPTFGFTSINVSRNFVYGYKVMSLLASDLRRL